jgi:hypothetical protein
VESLGQLVEGEVADGEEFKPELDQRCALWVDDDGANVAAVGAVDVVEVAEPGTADGAAVTSLLSHLVGDVSAGLTGLVLVEVARMPCMSWPTGVSSTDSVAEIRLPPRCRRSAITSASSTRLRAIRDSL